MLYRSPSSLCMVFDSISSNIDQVLLINPSVNVFVFGVFKGTATNIRYFARSKFSRGLVYNENFSMHGKLSS